MNMRIPPLNIKILLESNPPKSRILVRRLATCTVKTPAPEAGKAAFAIRQVEDNILPLRLQAPIHPGGHAAEEERHLLLIYRLIVITIISIMVIVTTVKHESLETDLSFGSRVTLCVPGK